MSFVNFFPLPTLIYNNVSISHPLTNQSKNSHIPCLKIKSNSRVLIRYSFLNSSFARPKTPCAKNSDSGEGDTRALETVLKLYDAIRERNTNALSGIIGEECRCVCNFISAFQPYYGKTQVISLFTTLMMILGSKIHFEVEPTSHHGMNVGITWKLEWSKNGAPLGKGFSFYMCHVYQGKVMIRNVEMFMEPLFHFEPFRLKTISIVMNITDKIGTYKTGTKRLFLIALLVMTTSFFMRLFLY